MKAGEVQAYTTAAEAEGMAGNFEVKDYDVSCCCEKILCGFTELHLGAEEVDRHTVCCLGLVDNKKRVPYGELSGVDKGTCCFICYNFTAGDLTPTDQNGAPQPFCPGCGCSESLVEEVVAELKARQTGRGAAGNILRIEKQTEKLINVEKKLDALLEHFNLEPQSMSR